MFKYNNRMCILKANVDKPAISVNFKNGSIEPIRANGQLLNKIVPLKRFEVWVYQAVRNFEFIDQIPMSYSEKEFLKCIK